MTESDEELHKRLADALRPPGAGASLVATRHQGLARIEPLTVVAEDWLRSYASEESSWDGSALVIEMRYFPDLAEAAIAAGLHFERDARPS